MPNKIESEHERIKLIEEELPLILSGMEEISLKLNSLEAGNMQPNLLSGTSMLSGSMLCWGPFGWCFPMTSHVAAEAAKVAGEYIAAAEMAAKKTKKKTDKVKKVSAGGNNAGDKVREKAEEEIKKLKELVRKALEKGEDAAKKASGAAAAAGKFKEGLPDLKSAENSFAEADGKLDEVDEHLAEEEAAKTPAGKNKALNKAIKALQAAAKKVAHDVETLKKVILAIQA